jgi:hypothetical protein
MLELGGEFFFFLQILRSCSVCGNAESLASHDPQPQTYLGAITVYFFKINI